MRILSLRSPERLALLHDGVLRFLAVLCATVAVSAQAPPATIPAPPDVAAPPADAAKTASGLATKVVTRGTGKDRPAKDDVVIVHYTGWKTDGTMFDSSIGKGKPAPGPLKPLIAVPTTAGTGSETTGVAIFDYTPLHAKTGIAHRRLKPLLGILDPENTRSMPRQVAATSGFDVLSHAIESYTALPFQKRPRPERPVLRPAYQGSNPISDVWSLEALRWVSKYFVRAVEDPDDLEAREKMQLAASYAGVGFGNAGVHLPHGMSYPVSGMVKDFRPEGFPGTHPIVPHGMSVILNAPAVFRFTAEACPDRHLIAAEILGADISRAKPEDAGKILSDRLIAIMQRLKVPNGLRSVGYDKSDIPALVKGTLPQARVTKLSPRPVNEADLAHLFEESLTAW